MRRLMTAGVLAGLALTGIARAQDQATDAPADAGAGAPAADAAAAPAGDYDAGTVLATVNGVEITLGHAIVMRDRLPAQYQSLPDEVLMQGIVDQLVDQTLLAGTVSATPQDDPLDVRLHVENERRGTLAAQVVQERIGAALDEAEIEAAYARQVAAFEPAQEFSAAHILVATEAEARDLKAQIDGGADFAELATAHSTDPGSGPNGGALGWFGPGQMVPEFEAAVAALEPGAVSEPVQTQFGWHVIRLAETRDTTPPPLAQLRPEIENALRQEKLEAELAALRAGAEIERPEAAAPPAAIRESGLLGD
jgi:peptidyl-prolyl cis-trans isomerase C